MRASARILLQPPELLSLSRCTSTRTYERRTRRSPILRVHTLDSSPKAIRYFDDVVRRDGGGEDYFTGRGEKPGQWLGSGLEHVGLRPGTEVEPDALHRVILHGEHPVTSDPLGERIRKDGIAGFGMTFSAPKSVSLLWAPRFARDRPQR